VAEPRFHVIFRTCDVVHSVHNAARPFDLDKRTLIKVCFLSLVKSLERIPHRITILGDRLSDEMIAFFDRFDADIISAAFGNDKSILRSVELACGSEPDEWVYLCEDDYLHVPHTFAYMSEFIANRHEYLKMRKAVRIKRGSQRFRDVPLVIHPADYPDRYWRHERKFSLIFLSTFCHWRQISNTTFTILAEASTFTQFRAVLEKSASGARDGYLSRKMYGSRFFGGKALCVSPIPGLASHMHAATMTPLVDWESLVEAYRKELSEYVVTQGSTPAYSEQSSTPSA
jgi:hypothetical protein